MCISERLKQVLDAKKMTVTEFSKVTGISYRSAMNYLNEGRDPNVDALVKIHKELEISITWLLTGNGAMFQAATQAYKPTSLQAYKPTSLQAYKPTSLQAYKPTSKLAISFQPCKFILGGW